MALVQLSLLDGGQVNSSDCSALADDAKSVNNGLHVRQQRGALGDGLA